MAYKPNRQVIYGNRYNNSAWTNLNDFVNSGAAATVVANHILFSGGAPDYSQKLFINDPTCLENWTFTVKLQVLTVGGGVAIGTYSLSSLGVNLFLVAKLNTTTGIFSLGVGGGSTPALFIQAVGTLAFGIMDDLEMVVSQRGAIASASIRNVTTQSAALSCYYTYIFINDSSRQTLPDNSRMGIWNLGGDFTISSLNWCVMEPKYAELLVIGDSKGDYFGPEDGARFSDLLNNYFTPTINNCGVGDTTSDVLTRIGEIIELRPKRVLMSIGSNDIRHLVPSATYIANYDIIVSQLIAVGIDVYHLVGFYEPAIDQTILQGHIIATYPADKIIDCLLPTMQNGLLVDGVHFNEKGHRVIANFILQSGKILGGFFTEQNVIRNQSEYTQSAGFNIDGRGLFIGDFSKIGVGVTIPTASIHLKAGKTSAGSAPIKVIKGQLMSNPEEGAVEFSDDGFYFTPAGTDRRAIYLAGRNAQAGTTYIVQASDHGKIIGLSNTAARVITLCPANAIPQGVVLWFKDEAGTAGAANITIHRASNDTIDGMTFYIIGTNFQATGLYSDGISKWFVL